MLIHVFFCILSSPGDHSTIRIIINSCKTFRKNNQFLTRNLVFLNRLSHNHLRNSLHVRMEWNSKLRWSKYQLYPMSEFQHPRPLSTMAKTCPHSKPIWPRYRSRRTYIQELAVSPLQTGDALLTLDTFNPLLPKRTYFILALSAMLLRRIVGKIEYNATQDSGWNYPYLYSRRRMGGVRG